MSRPEHRSAASCTVIIIIFSGVILLLLLCGKCAATDWQTTETKHTILYYQNLEDYEQYQKQVVSSDYVFGEVMTILGVSLADLRKMGRIKIYIYSDKKSLYVAYQRIYKKPCPFPAWYRKKTNSIYLTKNVTMGMLAHEMAHAVTNYCFTKQMGEILAKHVERRLK